MTPEVRAVLDDLQLPIAKPELDLARALLEEPAAVPSSNDPRMQTRLLILPCAAGTVTRSHGGVEAYFKGHRRGLSKGAKLRYGEALSISPGARFAFKVGDTVYSTGPHGMEWTPAALRGKRPSSWIVLCNGFESVSADPPGLDPRFAIGVAHGEPGPTVRSPAGFRPIWANFGEGGHWYSRP